MSTRRRYRRPDWADEFEAAGHRIAADGTIVVYHATTAAKAKKILEEGFLRRPADAPDSYGVCFSISPEVAENYGDGTLVKLRVPVEHLSLDDVFPSTGRMDFHARTHGGVYVPLALEVIPAGAEPNPSDIEFIRPVRYETKWYTTTDPVEAERLAKIDKTDHIRVTEGVHPVHVTGSWAYWSDHVFTTSIGMSKNDRLTKSLSSVAEQFINSLWGSDSLKSQKMLNNLAKIEAILVREPVAIGPSVGRPYAAAEIERYVVRLTDGNEKEFWTLSMGYPEGYLFEVATKKQKLITLLDDAGKHAGAEPNPLIAGWLTPDGEFIPMTRGEHFHIAAKKLGMKATPRATRAAMKKGWVRLGDMTVQFSSDYKREALLMARDFYREVFGDHPPAYDIMVEWNVEGEMWDPEYTLVSYKIPVADFLEIEGVGDLMRYPHQKVFTETWSDE